MVEKRPANIPQRAEPVDEAMRKHALDAREGRHEIDGNEIYELEGRRSEYHMPERHSGRLLRI